MKERWAVAVIVAVFAATSVYPILRARPYADIECIEMVQIRKMLDYGFAERRGIVLDVPATYGRVAHPEKFNYIHHPVPRNWPHAMACYFFGAFGALMFTVLLGLLESLLVYAALRRQFEVVPSLIAAVLYASAPALQFWAVGTTTIVLMVLVWPVAALLLLPGDDGKRRGSWRCFWLGLTVFLAGQVSWSMLGAVPSLLLMSAYTGADWKDALRKNLRNPLWWAIILGTSLSMLVFLGQLVFSAARLSEPFEYAAGLATEGARTKLLLFGFLRTVVLVSPALMLGLLLGLWAATRPRRLMPAAAGMMAYPLLFLLGMLLLPLFFSHEKWMSAWLLFPAAYLTAGWLSTTRTRVAIWGLLVLAIPGFVYIQAVAGLPRVSEATKMLARYLDEQTKPQDLILTDLQWRAFPFRQWDEVGLERVADRLAYVCVTLQQVEDSRKGLRGEVARTLYLHQSRGRAEEALLQKVRGEGRLLDRTELLLPAEVEEVGWLSRALSWWRHQVAMRPRAPDAGLLHPLNWLRQRFGSGATNSGNGSGDPTNQVVVLELYQLE